MVTRILLDVDTGTDDALALLYAVAHPDLEVLGISCVAGNSGLDQVVLNTLKVLDAAGAGDIPVAAGASRPLIERARPEGQFHGADGLGGIPLPEPRRTRSGLPAVEMLRQQILGSPEPVTLVALAPQTNVALLLAQHPDVAANLARIVFMGGSAAGGNVTAVAEFNVWQDPEAATAVVESGIPTTMYGLDVFNRLTVDEPTANRFRNAEHPAVRLAGELLHRRGARSDGSAQHYLGLIGDPGALVWLTNPELFTTATHPVRVNLAGIGRGQTIVDRRSHLQDSEALGLDPWPELEVALDLDVAAAAADFTRTVDRYTG
ncbi:MAG: Pyrimidine-specific ribonucleoside hydrolase [Friedmanniella sp.]|nr:Pyrimidine-specific ribonucleoside hydrolase [Friedmanniella sp.]